MVVIPRIQVPEQVPVRTQSSEVNRHRYEGRPRCSKERTPPATTTTAILKCIKRTTTVNHIILIRLLRVDLASSQARSSIVMVA